VNLSDQGIFGLAYNTNKSDSNYCDCCDFNWDSIINLGDFAIFGEHYMHSCPAGAYGSSFMAYCNPESRMDLDLIIDGSINDGIMEIKLVIGNVHDVSGVAIAINNEIDQLLFMDWMPNNQIHKTTLVAPVVNNGKHILYIGSFGGQILNGEHIELGTLRYLVVRRDEFLAAFNEKDLIIDVIFGEAIDVNNNIKTIENFIVKKYMDEVPIADYLSPNYPNPFNPSTVIEYGIAEDSHVKLSIYDVTGRLVITLINEHQKRNRYKIFWDGTNSRRNLVASGIYFYRLQTDMIDEKRKMIIIR
jgi:hypothetical protein